MKEYLVKIELESIKPNRDAGRMLTIIPGRKTAHFKTSKLPEEFINGENVIVNSYEVINGDWTEITGVIVCDELLKECANKKYDVEISIEVENRICEHSPIPGYTYKYEDTIIECYHCQEKSLVDELENDSYFNGEDDIYLENICPKCKFSDCCFLTFEYVDAAIDRRNKKTL